MKTNCLSRSLRPNLRSSLATAFLFTPSRNTSHSSRHRKGGSIISQRAKMRHIWVQLFSPPLSLARSALAAALPSKWKVSSLSSSHSNPSRRS